MLGPKVPVWRSRPYRVWVATHECFGCRIESYSQCAHDNRDKAKGKKAGDERSFPLCCTRPGKIGCHVEHDQCIDMTRDERDEMAARWVSEMQARAIDAGWKLPNVKRQEAA